MCVPHDNTNVTHMALGGPSIWHACSTVYSLTVSYSALRTKFASPPQASKHALSFELPSHRT